MSPMTTLDGVPEGKDVAIRTGDSVQRWQVTADGCLTRNGQRLEPFFLTGLLANGRIIDGDFSPAQPREWFSMGGRMFLVLTTTGDVAHCAQFRSGDFYRWSDEEQLVERGQRVPTPTWGSNALHAMCVMAHHQYKEAEKWRAKANNMNRARDYLRYVTDYTNSARELLER